MTNNIKFSIIIPTYNRGHLIAKTVQSALNQIYTNFEVIIIDDGSTDNTEEVIFSIKSPWLFYYKKGNAERAAARNFGAIKAKGDYITFLDSDDILYPFYLMNACESIEKNNFPPFVHLAYEIKDDKGNFVSKCNSIRSGSHKFLVYGNPLSCMGIFIRKEIFLKNKFNEDRRLVNSEDWELWLRIVSNYGIVTDGRISAAMIYHDNRSVLKLDELNPIQSKILAMQYAFMDEKVKAVFGKYRRQMNAYGNSYVALHLAIEGKISKAINYLLKAVVLHPGLIFSKRFFAVIKNLIKRSPGY